MALSISSHLLHMVFFAPPVCQPTIVKLVPKYGDAETLDEAKARFKTAWIAFGDSTDLRS